MKVAIVVGGLPFGGIENLIFDISMACKNRDNIEVIIINISGTGEKINDFIENGIKVINLFNSKNGLKVYKISTIMKLRKLIKELNPDIIHTMQFSGDYFGRLASIRLKIPIITHIHNIKRERHLHRRIINKLLSYKTNLYISVSKSVKDLVEKDHNIAGRKNIVLYNAINLGSFVCKDKRIDDNNINLIAVGRLVPQKNFHSLIKAFAELRKCYSNLFLIIVGEGKERNNLERLAKELNVEKYVDFVGYQKNVASYYENSHIFVLPSEYEGLPITHIEAIACGLPAVISENVPSKEIASKCSLICNTNPTSIKNNIEKLLNDKGLYKQLAEEAKILKETLEIKNYVENLISIYKETIKEYGK
ncbi:glycosyltransferase [Deferribacteraceae bacterium V6Fe1]|nr:glycosyltransferase [Deferribacteraceae bacterium V6Fe1]